MAVNINQNTNKVEIVTSVSQLQINTPGSPTTVQVSQPVTSTVNIVAQGPQGPAGLPGTTPNLSPYSGSIIVSGGLDVTQGITGSLFGTSSWSSRSISSSFALQSNSSSYSHTASYYRETDPVFTAVSGTFVQTSSFNSFTSSYNTGSFTGSFAGDGTGLYNIPASGITGLNLSQISSGSVSASISPDSGVQINTNVTATSFTGSLFGTASYARNGLSSSYSINSTSASYLLNPSTLQQVTTAGANTTNPITITTEDATALVINSTKTGDNDSYGISVGAHTRGVDVDGALIGVNITDTGYAALYVQNTNYGALIEGANTGVSISSPQTVGLDVILSTNSVPGVRVQGLGGYTGNTILVKDSIGQEVFRVNQSGGTAATSFTGSLFGTASYARNGLSSSYAQRSTSASYAVSGSYSLASTSASYSNTSTSASYSQNSTSASYSTNNLSSSYAETASYAPNYLPLTGGVINGNLQVIGTASFAYTTASVVEVGTNVIILSTDYPASRFGGISVVDSGSFGNSSTGSLFWDSLNNRWIYANPSGSTYDGGMLISGPRNTSGLGNETGMNSDFVAVGQGADHIRPGSIYNSGSITQVTGSLTVTEGISGSFSGSGENLYNIPASGITGLNLSQISSGSVSASISPDSGLQINTNVTATSFTGSLFGTASYAVTASFIDGGYY